MNNFEQTKERFDADAKAYDERIVKHVNGYLDLHLAILNMIPFKSQDSFTVLDLGIGSGRLPKEVLTRFPRCTLTGVDFAEQMLNMSRARLAEYNARIKLQNMNFGQELPEGKFNIIIMVLALHHLEDPQKKKLIKKLFDKIDGRGALLIGDLTKSSSQRITSVYMGLWRDNLRSNGYSEEYIQKCYHEKYEIEDIPATLEDQLKWLEKAGFDEVEVFWKRFHFVAFGGFKR